MKSRTIDIPTHALEGRAVRLEPYSDAVRSAVRAALDVDPVAWEVFVNAGQGQHFDGWWSGATLEVEVGTRVAYAIRRLADDKVVGTTSFLNIRREHQAVEIGATFLHPGARSSAVNPECKLLLMRLAFEQGVRRVELRTDARNHRSQAAIAKLGAVREGVLRRERITWTGHVRDTVVFSVTDLDWPRVRAGLEHRLGTPSASIARTTSSATEKLPRLEAGCD